MSFPHIYIIYFYFLLSFSHSSPLSTSFCHFLRLLLSFLSHFSLTVSSFYMLFIFTSSVSPSLLSYFLSAALFLHPLDLFLIVLALLSLHFLFFCLTSKSILSSPLSSFHFFSVMYWPHPFSSHLSLSFPSFHLSCLCLSSPPPSISIPPSPPSLSLSFSITSPYFSPSPVTSFPLLLSSCHLQPKKEMKGRKQGWCQMRGRQWKRLNFLWRVSMEIIHILLKHLHAATLLPHVPSILLCSTCSSPLLPSPCHVFLIVLHVSFLFQLFDKVFRFFFLSFFHCLNFLCSGRRCFWKGHRI